MRSLVFLLSLFLVNRLGAQELFDSIRTVEIKEERKAIYKAHKIDSMAVHATQYHNLGEVLQENANLYVKSYGIGSMASISMRGTNSTQSNLIWNGIALNSAFNGGVDLSLFPTIFIDEIEVQYGLNSMQYGSGGLGGAISFYTQPDFKEKRKVNFQQKVGSFALYNTHLKLDFGTDKFKSVSRIVYSKAENDFEYLNFSKYQRPKEKVQNAALEQMGILQSFYYQLSENKLLSADIWWYHSDRNLPPLMSSLKFKEGQKDETWRTILSYTNYYNKAKLKITTAFLKDEINYFNERAKSESHIDVMDWKNYAELEQKWGENIEASFRLNANYNRLLSVENESDKTDRKAIGAMAQVQYNFLPKWSFIGNLSEEILVDETDFLYGFVELNYNPSLAANEYIIYTRAGKNVKYPNLNDLNWKPGGNPNLKAEHNQAIEVGVRQSKNWFSSKYKNSLDLSSYYSTIDNYILWQPTIYGYWEAKNLKAVKLRGIEGRFKISNNFAKLKKKFSMNYTYTQALNTQANFKNDASVNQQLVYIPEHQFNLMGYLSYLNYYIKYNFNLMGARYITSDNSDYLPYYKLSDLTLGKKFSYKTHDFNFSFSVLNLMDENYQAILYRPMPGRNFLVTLNYTVKS